MPPRPRSTGQRIYLHDLSTGTRRIVSASDSLSDRALELSDDGRLVLYHRHERNPGGSQIWLLDLGTGEDREILNVGDARKAYGSWLDDQQHPGLGGSRKRTIGSAS